MGIDRGITLKRTSGPVYRTTVTPQGQDILNSTCQLKPDLLDYFIDHELFAHAICQFGDPTPPETVGYSPSIFNSDHISPNATDIAYRKLGYTLKF